MSEPINPYPLSPARWTAENVHAAAITMADQLQHFLGSHPTPDQWQVIESYALAIASTARKGRSAAVLVQAAKEAHTLHVQQHAHVQQPEPVGRYIQTPEPVRRYLQTIDDGLGGPLHPIFANIIKAAGMQ